jgi:hypothetical protein
MNMKTSPLLFPYHRGVKALGLAILLFAIAGLLWKTFHDQPIFPLDPVPQLIGLGLVFIFFSKEKVEDERIHYLKFQALSVGFLSCFFMSMGFNSWYRLSAPEFIAATMVFSTSVYYFFKRKI